MKRWQEDMMGTLAQMADVPLTSYFMTHNECYGFWFDELQWQEFYAKDRVES